jgi:HPt (histidine-containing phosphotransfer) domain-containing protein
MSPRAGANPLYAIDLEVIEQLEESMRPDVGFVDQLARIFLRELDRRMVELEKGMREGNGEEIAMAAHAIKGSCSHFGAHRMMALCASVERLALGGEVVEVARPIADLIEEAGRVRAALEAWLNRLRYPG